MPSCPQMQLLIIKYIPLQQGLRRNNLNFCKEFNYIIKYIPLQQGLRLSILRIVKKCVYY